MFTFFDKNRQKGAKWKKIRGRKNIDDETFRKILSESKTEMQRYMGEYYKTRLKSLCEEF